MTEERKNGNGVSRWRDWHDAGAFKNEDASRGALYLARQQWLDGLSNAKSMAEWIGMSESEFAAWVAPEDAIPKPKKGYKG